MTSCQFRHEPSGELCGKLARWVVIIEGRRILLCTIHKMTAVSRDPDLRVEQA